MTRIKDILQEVTVSNVSGADYSSLNSAVSNSTIKTYRIESAVTLTADITMSVGSTVIIGTTGSIAGAYTLTGNNTVLVFEGDQSGINTNVIFAGTWICDVVKPEWWGALGDGETDDYTAILDAIAFCKLTASKKLQ